MEQMKSAMEIKKEMNSLSMVDEFAKYAKLQRRLNQITMDIESSGMCIFQITILFVKFWFAFITEAFKTLKCVVGHFTAGCRQMLQDRLYKWILGGLCVVLGIVYLSLLGIVGTSTPVFVVPKYWFAPLHTLLAYPTGIDGAISIPIWTVVTRNALSYLVKV
jgi:hypothetical protein